MESTKRQRSRSTLNDAARNHLEKYWRLSRERFNAGDFALAAFLAITLIEEVGKVVILEGVLMGDVIAKTDFRNHQSKYVYAVGATLAVNSRVTRVYGKDEGRFAEWFKTEKLFEIRNSALYLENRGTDIVVPEQAINRTDALLLVCIAGEVYGEIQGRQAGTGPSEWQRILSEVDQFRSSTQVSDAT